MRYDVVVVGAGLDGLVAAASLARAGQRVLVLEKQAVAGGRAQVEEMFPGYRVSPVASFCGPLRPGIVKSLRLGGLRYLQPDPSILALSADGKHLTLWQSTKRACDEIARFSKKDAQRYPLFVRFMQRSSKLLEDLQEVTPPPLSATDPFQFWDVAQLAVRFRLLPREDRVQMLRVGAMPAADFLDEWFESPLLKAALAAPALWASFPGPRAPGTAACLLYQESLGENLVPRGGMGAVAEALLTACREAGAEVRLNAEVAAISNSGVRLASNEVILADTVLSNVDPKSTVLDLLEGGTLSLEFTHQIEHIKMRGATARIHLALKGLPQVAGLSEENWRGRIHIGEDLDALEKAWDDAKYGRCSDHPVFELHVPTLAQPSLAPAGHHILSISVRSAPYHLRSGGWGDFADQALAALQRYLPKLSDLVVHRKVLTPIDLERDYGLREGHIQRGEYALDQLFHARPTMACSRYSTPLSNLYLCGAGTHPGGIGNGASGANAAREMLARNSSSDPSRKRALALSSLGAGLALVGAGVAAKAALDLLRKPTEKNGSTQTAVVSSNGGGK